MVKHIIILLSVILMTGCAGFKAKNIVEVKVPVLYCPAPVEYERPNYNTSYLKPSDKGDWEKIAKAYVVTLLEMQAYTEKLELIIESYRGLNNGIADQ